MRLAAKSSTQWFHPSILVLPVSHFNLLFIVTASAGATPTRRFFEIEVGDGNNLDLDIGWRVTCGVGRNISLRGTKEAAQKIRKGAKNNKPVRTRAHKRQGIRSTTIANVCDNLRMYWLYTLALVVILYVVWRAWYGYKLVSANGQARLL